MSAPPGGRSRPLSIIGSTAVVLAGAAVLVLGPLVTLVGAASRGSGSPATADNVTLLGAAATVTAGVVALLVAVAVAAVLVLSARFLLRGVSWARGVLATVTVLWGLFSVLGGPFDRSLETSVVTPLLVVGLILAFVESSTRFVADART